MIKPDRNLGSTYVLLGGKVSPLLATFFMLLIVIGFKIKATL